MAGPAPTPASAPWTQARFAERLGRCGTLRFINSCGPSTFEAIAPLAGVHFSDGFFNAINERFHWHVRQDGLRHVKSVDRTHARSGRRVLFFELREAPDAKPFLLVYLYRAPGEAFDPDCERAFLEAHAELSEGRILEREDAR